MSWNFQIENKISEDKLKKKKTSITCLSMNVLVKATLKKRRGKAYMIDHYFRDQKRPKTI